MISPKRQDVSEVHSVITGKTVLYYILYSTYSQYSYAGEIYKHTYTRLFPRNFVITGYDVPGS
jgi:hypothetical protein